MERRQFLRVPIDAPHFICVALEDGTNITTLLVDLSRGGLQTAFSPGQELTNNYVLGTTVIVSQLPGSVEQASGTKIGFQGTVSWVSPQRFGVRFDEPLPLGDEELAGLVEGL